MLVRSGREPPVLWAAGLSEVVSCWSGDGNMLQKTAWAVNNQQHGIRWHENTGNQGASKMTDVNIVKYIPQIDVNCLSSGAQAGNLTV